MRWSNLSRFRRTGSGGPEVIIVSQGFGRSLNAILGEGERKSSLLPGISGYMGALGERESASPS